MFDNNRYDAYMLLLSYLPVVLFNEHDMTSLLYILILSEFM